MSDHLITLPSSFSSHSILADIPGSSRFTYTNAAHLDWSWRGPRVLREISNMDADILSLQELNRYEDVAAVLAPTHAALFVPKLYSPAVRVGSGAPPDGVALFVRRRFEIVDVEVLYIRSRTTGLLSNQVALIATLRDTVVAGGSRFLVVAATHLASGVGAESDVIRAEQAATVVSAARSAVVRAKSFISNSTKCTVPTILLGDLNSEPTSPAAHAIALTLNGDSGGASVFEKPDFTTYKWTGNSPPKLARRTVDYIWLTKDKGLSIGARRRLPTETQIGEYGLPSEEWPSDHLPLAVKLVWD